MLNDKTNKLLIFQSSRSIQEQLNDKAHTHTHICTHTQGIRNVSSFRVRVPGSNLGTKQSFKRKYSVL